MVCYGDWAFYSINYIVSIAFSMPSSVIYKEIWFVDVRSRCNDDDYRRGNVIYIIMFLGNAIVYV